MIIILNGTDQEVADHTTIADVVARTRPEDTTGRGIAVAVDKAVVPRARWSDSVLADGARVEIVSAVQGG
ncbi:sulfur carrier protein ThiS [Propionibacteriaceae bacterium Y2011]|uniref:sulfur carrier protein ThiS n=1 Tax=Microlunatus sp. Y2014 TaxID=3418488 RepID=UPI003B4576C9